MLQDYVGTLPAVDRAEAFGQHPNADIAYQIEDSWVVLESLLSLQPQAALAPGAKSREDTVGAICADLLDQVQLQQRSQQCLTESHKCGNKMFAHYIALMTFRCYEQISLTGLHAA